MDKLKAYIEIDGRWCHVTLVEAVEQKDLFGGTVVMFAYRRSKKSREVELAPRERFHKKKPKAETKRKKEEEN